MKESVFPCCPEALNEVMHEVPRLTFCLAINHDGNEERLNAVFEWRQQFPVRGGDELWCLWVTARCDEGCIERDGVRYALETETARLLLHEFEPGRTKAILTLVEAPTWFQTKEPVPLVVLMHSENLCESVWRYLRKAMRRSLKGGNKLPEPQRQQRRVNLTEDTRELIDAIREVRAKHPNWGYGSIAQELGKSRAQVRYACELMKRIDV